MLQSTPALVENLLAPQEQLQPNGVDLTIREVSRFTSSGRIGADNESRVLSDISLLGFDVAGKVDLAPGPYLITHNEVINLPKDIMALARPRSSLLRCGVSIHTAVWDAGYSGRSRSLMVVYNPHGFCLHKNARLIQLVFFRITSEVVEGYKGVFQGENM